MLDFTVLLKQFHEMVVEQKTVRRTYEGKIALACDTLESWSPQWRVLREKVGKSRTSWLLAGNISEPLRATYPTPFAPKILTVIATDGSQIFPDRHEFSPCHLINLGVVILHYGTGERPLLTSRPMLFHRERDMYREWNGKRMPVNAEVISALRGAFEMQELALFAAQSARENRETVGFSDGTLILWNLEGKPQQFQQEILAGYLHCFEQLKSDGVPVLGYISQPKSADVIHALRVGLCPENPTNCDRCPHKGKVPELPCEPIDGVTDADLFAEFLDEGERSILFKSSSAILEAYGSHHIHFFYLHAGYEIVRIEVPQWVTQRPALLDLVHAAAYDQAQKGMGYPVSLSEAHEQAIIRGNEREQFYRLLEKLYVHEGFPVAISRKSLKKRHVGI